MVAAGDVLAYRGVTMDEPCAFIGETLLHGGAAHHELPPAVPDACSTSAPAKLARAPDQGLDGIERYAEHRGDVLQAQPGDAAEQKHFALGQWQCRQSTLQPRHRLLYLRQLPGAVIAAGRVPCLGVAGHAVAAFVTKVIAHAVGRDGEQPRPQGRDG